MRQSGGYFTVVMEEWSLVDARPIYMIINGGEEVLLGEESEKILLHARVPFDEKEKPVVVLIDTGSSCNVLQKGYSKKHDLLAQPCKNKLTGFNGSTSVVMGLVHVLVPAKKWKVGENQAPMN